MDKKEFSSALAEDVKFALGQKGIEVETSVNTVDKLNGSYEALVIGTSDGNTSMGACLKLEPFWESYDSGTEYQEVLRGAIDAAMSGMKSRPPKETADFLREYSKMKDHLYLQVVSAETNKELLKDVPHWDIEDMAVVCRVIISSDETGSATCLLTSRHLEVMGITPEQLFADALESAPVVKPIKIQGMSEVLAEILGEDQAKAMGIIPEGPEQLYVAGVPDKIYGAGVLAYPGFFEQAAKRLGGDFYVLPSSVHEVLLYPDQGRDCLNEFETMVKDVNAQAVKPEDRLTDNVYHYDHVAGVFELGRKFAARRTDEAMAI